MLDRLGEKVVDPQVRRPFGVAGATDRSKDNDDGILRKPRVPLEEIEAVAVGKREIQQHHIRPGVVQVCVGLGEVLSLRNFMARLCQALHQRPPQQVFVLDEEDPRHGVTADPFPGRQHEATRGS